MTTKTKDQIRQRQYYLNNIEKIQKRRRELIAEDPEKAAKQRKNQYERYMVKGKLNKQKLLKRNLDYINEIKLRLGCENCGYKEHAVALDFDHIDPTTKTSNVARFRHSSMERLKNEVAKCRVLCSNCHRVKTWGDTSH